MYALVIPGDENGLERRRYYYEIAVRQFQQQILPDAAPTTWSYGSVNHPGTFNYPASPSRPSAFGSGQVDQPAPRPNFNFLPHLLPVDQTLHWANLPGASRTGYTPTFRETPALCRSGSDDHLHGGHTAQESDGYAEAWFPPEKANNIPAGFATEGYPIQFLQERIPGKVRRGWDPGTATFQYENDQRAGLRHHDHTLGMTRLNVMRDRQASISAAWP
jgi:hypothetical protein